MHTPSNIKIIGKKLTFAATFFLPNKSSAKKTLILTTRQIIFAKASNSILRRTATKSLSAFSPSNSFVFQGSASNNLIYFKPWTAASRSEKVVRELIKATIQKALMD